MSGRKYCRHLEEGLVLVDLECVRIERKRVPSQQSMLGDLLFGRSVRYVG